MELLTPALLRKILLTILAGVAFLGAGIIFAYLTKDYDLILLSLLIFGFCLFRAFVLWRMCWKGTYATVSGICDEITPHPMEQYMKVQVVLPDNTVREIILTGKLRFSPAGNTTSTSEATKNTIQEAIIWMPRFPGITFLDLMI